MGDFTELPVQTGVGDYHINRYRIAFTPPPSASAAALASDLIDNFPSYLKSQFATVEFGDHKHEGKDTLRFHGYARLLGFDIGFLHTDWVAREWVNRAIGFTAQTLKREFFLAGEDIGLAAPTVAGGLVGEIAGAAGVYYNRMHFLAGRRSWRISDGAAFGVSGGVLVLETVAVERFSATPFRVADAVIGLESKLPDVWVAMLANFVDKRRLTAVRQPLKPRWTNKGRVDYMTRSLPGFRRDGRGCGIPGHPSSRSGSRARVRARRAPASSPPRRSGISWSLDRNPPTLVVLGAMGAGPLR